MPNVALAGKTHNSSPTRVNFSISISDEAVKRPEIALRCPTLRPEARKRGLHRPQRISAPIHGLFSRSPRAPAAARALSSIRGAAWQLHFPQDGISGVCRSTCPRCRLHVQVTSPKRTSGPRRYAVVSTPTCDLNRTGCSSGITCEMAISRQVSKVGSCEKIAGQPFASCPRLLASSYSLA
jgi:hypothetical protein